MPQKPVTFIGVPMHWGEAVRAMTQGPTALRSRDMVEKLHAAGLMIHDAGDVSCADVKRTRITNPKLKCIDEVMVAAGRVARMVDRAVRKHERPLVVGGDHSLAIGTIGGASRALGGNIGLVWIDAHGDMNTDKTTETGNIHGMPLAAVMGVGAKQLTSIYGPKPKVKFGNMVHVAGWDFDPGERALVEERNLATFEIPDILAHGFGPAFAAISKLAKRVRGLWVSLDLDSIVQSEAPGVTMPSRTGLSYREIMTLARYIGKHPNVTGVCISEFNPTNDVDHRTADLVIELAAAFLGSRYDSYSEYLMSHPTK